MADNSEQGSLPAGHGRGRGLLAVDPTITTHMRRGRGPNPGVIRYNYDHTANARAFRRERTRTGDITSFDHRPTTTTTTDPTLTACTTRHDHRPVWSVAPGNDTPALPPPAQGMTTTLQSDVTRVSINSNNTTEFT